jgi:hypothetical protein
MAEKPSGFSFEDFNRNFLDPETPLSCIGGGSLGGKAQGLASIRTALRSELKLQDFPGIQIEIPRLVVLRTDAFDAFMRGEHLQEIADSNASLDRIAHAFQNAEMPFEVLGDLRALIDNVHTPLAIRSSSLLEDSAHAPFAGIYETKMIPNHQFDPDERFRHLIEAIKFVYTSTYSQKAKEYRKLTGYSNRDEKMAVVIQEMVGKRYYQSFYPELSGVARSFNYYPVAPSRPEDGMVSLALGLGKTIVDGGTAWVYSPSYPASQPPFSSPAELLDSSQRHFWAVNMGGDLEYDPSKETEYMIQQNLRIAEGDGVLQYLVSTYDSDSDRLVPGISLHGSRALTFAPLLVLKELPFNDLITRVLHTCEQSAGSAVEIEFAMTFNPHRFCLLQVRPMTVPSEDVHLAESDLTGKNVLAASNVVLGNGVVEDIVDIVFTRPERFDIINTASVVPELAALNSKLLDQHKPYLLIVFGRLGTTNPSMGIPISWEQVNGAYVIVEATRENVKVGLSQGTHYFLNLINLGVKYFSLPLSSPFQIDWQWLSSQPVVEQTDFLTHVQLSAPIHVRVDGRKGKGVIYKP